MAPPKPSWKSSTKFALALLCITTGLSTPRLSSDGILKSELGFLILIPIFVLMVTISLPCTYLELCLGQYSGQSSINLWNLSPIFRGIGAGGYLTLILCQICYQVYSCYMFDFATSAFTTEITWTSCNNSWNQINCYTNNQDNLTRRLKCFKEYSQQKCEGMNWQSSVEQYWLYHILNIVEESQSNYFGGLQPRTIICILVTGVFIFLANYKGSTSIQNLLWFLMVFPTAELLVLFFISLVDTGGVHGLLSGLTPDFSKLKDTGVWKNILKAMLLNNFLGLGVFTTLGSQCEFRNPQYARSIYINLLHVLASLCYSITIGNFIGILSYHTNTSIEEILRGHRSVIGSIMPEALSFAPGWTQAWIFLWFSNMYLLALRNLIMMMYINLEIFLSIFTRTRKYRILILLAFSLFNSGASILICTRFGYEFLAIMMKTLEDYIIIFLNFVQLLALVYFYGILKLRDDIHFMIGVRPSSYWTLSLSLAPIFLSLILIYTVLSFYKTMKFKFWGLYCFQNVMIWYGPGLVVLFAAYYFVKLPMDEYGRLCKPSSKWGPRDPKMRTSRRMFTTLEVTDEYIYRQGRMDQNAELLT